MYEIYERICKEKGYTNYFVQKNTGISKSILSRWKNGKGTPRLETLKKIADCLGVPVDVFIEDTSTKKTTHYYNDEIVDISERIVGRSDLKELFYLCKDLSQEQIQVLINTVSAFTNKTE